MFEVLGGELIKYVSGCRKHLKTPYQLTFKENEGKNKLRVS